MMSENDEMGAMGAATLASMEQSSVFKLNEEAMNAVVQQLIAEPHRMQRKAPRGLPVRFDSEAAAMNFYCVLALIHRTALNHEDALLRNQPGRTLDEQLLFGIMGMHISGSPLTAAALAQVDLSDVASNFQVPLTEDKGEEVLPGVQELKAHELRRFAREILAVFHDAAKQLNDAGHDSLASFVLDVLRPRAVEQQSASRLVKALTSTFQGFQGSMKLADGTEIPFSCTADTLADDLWRRYKASDAPRFDFADTNQLCCVPDKALHSSLIATRVLENGPSANGAPGMDERWAADLAALQAVRLSLSEAESITVEPSAFDVAAGLHSLAAEE